MNIQIVEVSPRDGLQSETSVLATSTKVELISRLIATGVTRLEATSFVNPKRVPQLADAETVMAAFPRPRDASLIGLVLNRRGFERARLAGCDEVGMAVVASNTFNLRNQGVPTEQSIADWIVIARAAHDSGIKPHVTISAAFGCPFEGEIDPAVVVGIAKQCAEGEPTEICIADTIGAAVPTGVTELIARLRKALPSMPLRAHFHNTRNTGLANAYAALQSGVTCLDSSAGGLGGCPFAPAATGNIPTEDLLYMLGRMGLVTGIDVNSMIATATWLEDQIGHPAPGLLMKAGAFPRPNAK